MGYDVDWMKRGAFFFFLTVIVAVVTVVFVTNSWFLQIIDRKEILGGEVKNYGCVKFVACCRRLLWLKYYLNFNQKKANKSKQKQIKANKSK